MWKLERTILGGYLLHIPGIPYVIDMCSEEAEPIFGFGLDCLDWCWVKMEVADDKKDYTIALSRNDFRVEFHHTDEDNTNYFWSVPYEAWKTAFPYFLLNKWDYYQVKFKIEQFPKELPLGSSAA